MFIIKLLLFLFLFFVISVLITVVRVVWKIRQMHQQVRQQYKDNSRSEGSGYYSGTEGEIITDTRDPQKANRKIIADDEGEYIDFVED